MNRDEMLARLLSQAAGEGAELVTLRAVVEEASEMGAERVLTRMGLNDAQAHGDLSELCSSSPAAMPPASMPHPK